MNRKKLLLFLLTLSLSSSSQLMFKLGKDTLYNFVYSEGDEFNGDKLNEDYWLNGLGWTRVLMSQDLAFNPNNVKLGDGLLRLIADKKDSLYNLGIYEVDSNMIRQGKIVLENSRFLTKYSAGCIITKKKLHYGFYELRFKVEEGQGIWPAFWFFGGKQNEEIDVFELKGEKKKLIHVDTHCPNGCDRGYTDKFSFSKNWGAWMPVAENIHNGFHLMQLEWTPEYIVWYFNGFPMAYFSGRFSNPMNLYLNTSVAKDGEAFKPGPNADTKWPNTYSADYIRVWHSAGSSDTLALTPGPEFTVSKAYESNYKNAPVRKRGLSYKKGELNPLKGFIFLSLGIDNTLSIRFNGDLSASKTDIRLQSGLLPETRLDPKQEYKIQIPKSESELILIVKTGKKEYRKHLMLLSK